MGVPTTSTGPHAADLDTLRKIAEAATLGPWTLEYENSDDWEAGINDGDYPHTIHGPRNCSFDNWTDKSKIQDYLNRVTEISEMVDEDAEFIVTFDPPTVLALLSRLEQAEQLVQINNQAMLEQAQRAEQAEQAVQRVREFSAQLSGYCSPYGVAHDYAKQLDRALDGDQA